MKIYDTIIIGAGAAGIMAAISSAKSNKTTLLLEKLPKIATKLKATGGGRCNLTNTLDRDSFMQSFGKEGRFMSKALDCLSNQELQQFFNTIGVETHAPDGFRVFPITHSSTTIISALAKELDRLNIDVKTSQKVEHILTQEKRVTAVQTSTETFYTNAVVIATGGRGYPQLGAEGDGYTLAKELGHKIIPPHPAMMPLKTKESWVANCRADTVSGVKMQVAIKKYKKLHAIGDLIFTKDGVRGPVVLDFSREITPLLAKYDEVPITINLTKGKNQEQILQHIKSEIAKNKHTLLTLLETLLPTSIAKEFIKMVEANEQDSFSKLAGSKREALIKMLAQTPLTVVGHDGFKMAMVTRGGISLKEIGPNTLQSKLIKGLYFCGEVVNLDGPCGGYNLQWAFSSGYLAGKSSTK